MPAAGMHARPHAGCCRLRPRASDSAGMAWPAQLAPLSPRPYRIQTHLNSFNGHACAARTSSNASRWALTCTRTSPAAQARPQVARSKNRHGTAARLARPCRARGTATPICTHRAQRSSAERESEPATSDPRGRRTVAVAILKFSQPYRCERPPHRALCAPQRQCPRPCRHLRQRHAPPASRGGGGQRLLAPHWEPGAALSRTGDKGAALRLPAAVLSATAMPSSPPSQSS